jgi:hypothetical protein
MMLTVSDMGMGFFGLNRKGTNNGAVFLVEHCYSWSVSSAVALVTQVDDPV